MEIRRYLSIVQRRAVLIVCIAAAAIGAGWLIVPRSHSYTASSTLYVGSRSIDINPTSGEVSGDRVTGLDRLISTFTALVRTRPIAAAAVASAHVARSPDEVVSNTRAEQVPNTDLIRVSVSDASATTSQVLANAVASSLVEQIRTFEPRDSTAATEQVLSVYENATVPAHPNPSGLLRILILAGLFGVIVAGAVVALLEHLDITLRSADDAERQLELPVLGVVPALGNRLAFSPAHFVDDRALDLSASGRRRRGLFRRNGGSHA